MVESTTRPPPPLFPRPTSASSLLLPKKTAGEKQTVTSSNTPPIVFWVFWCTTRGCSTQRHVQHFTPVRRTRRSRFGGLCILLPFLLIQTRSRLPPRDVSLQGHLLSGPILTRRYECGRPSSAQALRRTSPVFFPTVLLSSLPAEAVRRVARVTRVTTIIMGECTVVPQYWVHVLYRCPSNAEMLG